jgi:aryl-alcohol dehydrogenase-like predicted oxidoreductase
MAQELLSKDKLTLVEQRNRLRAELHEQREIIARQLEPAATTHNGYPRSMTMRFLTQHSVLAGSLFTGATSLLLGARYIKSLTAALTMFKLVRAATNNQKR